MQVDVSLDVILKGRVEDGEIVGIPNTSISSILKTIKNKGYKINVFSSYCSELSNYRKLVKWCTKHGLVPFINSYSIRADIAEDNILIDKRSIGWKGIPDLYNKVEKLKTLQKEGKNDD